ncbi:hypothetical protein ACW0JT_12740 [Arthrobacter sp. SA17]
MDKRHALYCWVRNNPFKVDPMATGLLFLAFDPVYLVADRPLLFFYPAAS